MFRKSWRLFIPNLALCVTIHIIHRFKKPVSNPSYPVLPDNPNTMRHNLNSNHFLKEKLQDKGLLHATARKAQRTNPESITSRVFHIPARPELIISVAPMLNMPCWEALVLHLSIHESIQQGKNGGTRYIWGCESKYNHQVAHGVEDQVALPCQLLQWARWWNILACKQS